jgi:hypothetical protein
MTKYRPALSSQDATWRLNVKSALQLEIRPSPKRLDTKTGWPSLAKWLGLWSSNTHSPWGWQLQCLPKRRRGSSPKTEVALHKNALQISVEDTKSTTERGKSQESTKACLSGNKTITKPLSPHTLSSDLRFRLFLTKSMEQSAWEINTTLRLSRNSPPCLESQASWKCSKEFTNGPNPKPDKQNPHPPTLFAFHHKHPTHA